MFWYPDETVGAARDLGMRVATGGVGIWAGQSRRRVRALAVPESPETIHCDGHISSCINVLDTGLVSGFIIFCRGIFRCFGEWAGRSGIGAGFCIDNGASASTAGLPTWVIRANSGHPPG